MLRKGPIMVSWHVYMVRPVVCRPTWPDLSPWIQAVRVYTHHILQRRAYLTLCNMCVHVCIHIATLHNTSMQHLGSAHAHNPTYCILRVCASCAHIVSNGVYAESGCFDLVSNPPSSLLVVSLVWIRTWSWPAQKRGGTIPPTSSCS